MKRMVGILIFMLLSCISTSAFCADVMSNQELSERVKQLEEKLNLKEGILPPEWTERITFSGLIEVEASHQKINFDDPDEEDTKENDVDLASVELGVDVKIAAHVEGHVLFKYEDDDVFVDDGFISLDGGDAFPAYLTAGKLYIPFGNFDSHFVTDPGTLVLGETCEGAVLGGYRLGGETADLSLGLFNGRISEKGDDDVIDSFFAAVTFQPFEFLTTGVSYTSNLGSSNALFEDAIESIEVEDLKDLVGGWSIFCTVEFLERFKVIGEYVGALDDFQAGELYSKEDTKARRPSAWNFELGAVVIDSLELAVRCGGSDDGADFLPETQFGAVVNWGFFKNTNLALEYMHDDFEDDVQEADTFTAQLAVEF